MIGESYEDEHADLLTEIERLRAALKDVREKIIEDRHLRPIIDRALAD